MVKLVVLLLAIACTVAHATHVDADIEGESVVTLSNGKIRGVVYRELGVRAFYSVPFGVAQRFGDPSMRTEKWNSTLDCSVMDGVGCPQECVLPPHVCPTSISENCLTIDIYAPLSTASLFGSLDTQLWNFGGGYVEGSANTPLYNGSMLAAQGLVVGVPNYRVGAFGFFVSGTDASFGDLSGNFGLKDQILALRFLGDEGPAFGAREHSKAMIFGQSAGGMSTMALLLSPMAKPYYSSAMIHSDPLGMAYAPGDKMVALSEALAKRVGCAVSDVECLRAVPLQTLLDNQLKAIIDDGDIYKALYQAGAPWEPWVDGKWLAGQPLELVPQGYVDVPVAIGTVANEGNMFVYSALTKPMGRLLYPSIVKLFYGNVSSQVRAQFPCHSSDCRPVLSELLTASLFSCASQSVARSLATLNKQPAYLWMFNHSITAHPPGTNSTSPLWGPGFENCAVPGIVCHGSELPFVFGTLGDSDIYQWGPGEAGLASATVVYWSNFGRSQSTPNEPQAVSVKWPQYNEANGFANIHVDQAGQYSVANDDYTTSSCAFFDKIGYSHGTYYDFMTALHQAKKLIN
jgi:carboxylesterase type B